MADPKLLVGVGRGTKNLFRPQLTGDLARAAASGAHGENPANNLGGLIIHHQLFAVVFVLSVAVGRPGSKPFPSFRFCLENGPNLAAGVPNILFVEQIFERHQFVALAAVGIHIVVDGDVADTEHGEAFLDVQPCVQLVTAQAGQVFRDDDPNLAILHVGHHLLETGPLKIGPGIAIVHVKARIRKVVVSGVSLQDHFLILNAV